MHIEERSGGRAGWEKVFALGWWYTLETKKTIGKKGACARDRATNRNTRLVARDDFFSFL
jgi:hypothetical protein